MSSTTTETIEARPHLSAEIYSIQTSRSLRAAGSSQRITRALAELPKLSREQCGHIRHFHNLASQLDGDWSFMGAQETGQEWETAYRYQIATMAYAAGSAHYHHLPAMRSVFKGLLGRLITKMLRKEVWGYWYLTSQSGIRLDPDLKELRKPWADPVCRENIMYSGHLLLMVSLYTMLFNDPLYDTEGSITFKWDPLFWGMGDEVFHYTRNSLQLTILKEMERENWMGVCCEPNLIFIVCNQFPIIATRYNDVINGTNIVDEVLSKYKAAWAEKGMIAENGLFRRCYVVKRDAAPATEDIGHPAWTMAFMPWNYDTIQRMYPSTGDGYLEKIGNRVNIHPPPVTKVIKEIIAEEGGRHDDPAVVARAREITAGMKPSRAPFFSPTFGYVAQWLSEVAGPDDRDRLLLHADKYMNPSWSKGGLYYKRCDAGWDAHGNYLHVEPYTGNAAIGYARLNVKDGQKKMWDEPWTKHEVESRPWIDGIDLDQNVDVLRGTWDDEREAMVATFRTWNGNRVVLRPVVKALPSGTYGVYVDGELRTVSDIAQPSDEIAVDIEVGEAELNLVLLRE